MKRIAAAGVLALLVLPGAASAQTRSEAPIREVVLTDGARRYAVPIKVGATVLDAGLDSGSTGLRVLPKALGDGDAKAGGESDRYSYGSGTLFEGRVGAGTISIGEASGPGPLQLVEKFGCTAHTPQCPAGRVPPDQFGIQGDGLPGEGFRAILGVSMAHAKVQNPLSAIGVKRWIIELPRPGTGAAGKLILDPNDDEIKDFLLFPLLPAFRQSTGDLHDALQGCILNNTNGEKACGPVTMDTGAPGIYVTNSKLGPTPWPNGTASALAFFRDDQPAAIEMFTVGQRNHASRLVFEHNDQSNDAIRAGLSPYFAFDVLYLPAQNMIGLKPREAAPNAPKGLALKPPK